MSEAVNDIYLLKMLADYFLKEGRLHLAEALQKEYDNEMSKYVADSSYDCFDSDFITGLINVFGKYLRIRYESRPRNAEASTEVNKEDKETCYPMQNANTNLENENSEDNANTQIKVGFSNNVLPSQMESRINETSHNGVEYRYIDGKKVEYRNTDKIDSEQKQLNSNMDESYILKESENCSLNKVKAEKRLWSFKSGNEPKSKRQFTDCTQKGTDKDSVAPIHESGTCSKTSNLKWLVIGSDIEEEQIANESVPHEEGHVCLNTLAIHPINDNKIENKNETKMELKNININMNLNENVDVDELSRKSGIYTLTPITMQMMTLTIPSMNVGHSDDETENSVENNGQEIQLLETVTRQWQTIESSLNERLTNLSDRIENCVLNQSSKDHSNDARMESLTIGWQAVEISLHKRIDQLTEDIQKLAQSQFNQVEINSQIEKQLASITGRSDFEWRIEGIASRFLRGTEEFSQPFYSDGSDGYKMRLWCGMDSSTGFYMTFNLIPGDYDNLLQWPMERPVLIDIIDVQFGLPVLSRRLPCSTVEQENHGLASGKTHTNRNYGNGVIVCLSREQLKIIPGAIRNDTMFIRCRVLPN